MASRPGPTPKFSVSNRTKNDLVLIAARALRDLARSPTVQARLRTMSGARAGWAAKRQSRSQPTDRRERALALRLRLRRIGSMADTLSKAAGDDETVNDAITAAERAVDHLRLRIRLAVKLPSDKQAVELAVVAREAGDLEDGLLRLFGHITDPDASGRADHSDDG